jgi:hypothetical protein
MNIGPIPPLYYHLLLESFANTLFKIDRREDYSKGIGHYGF